MVDAREEKTAGEEKAARAGDLTHRVSWRGRLARWGIAFILGIVSSIIFAPVEWGWAAWFVLVPLLVMIERQPRGHFGIGLWWGFGHFLFCLAWLREVLGPAPLGVGMICAAFPAIFAWAVGLTMRYVRWNPSDDLVPKNGRKPLAMPLPGPVRQVLITVIVAALWCGSEWLRAVFYTGFPWNQFGVSQWANGLLLPVVAYTSVYGLSFLIAAVNVGLFLAILPWLRKERETRKRLPVGLVMAVFFVILTMVIVPKPVVPEAKTILKVACIQGNIPQMRVPTPEQGELAITVYREQTQDAARGTITPELIVWPETALPWAQFKPSLHRDGPPSIYLKSLMDHVKIPMLIGTVDYREGEGVDQTFNSAVLVDTDGNRLQTYDKMKAVPFGEFIPLSRFFPEWFKNILKKHHLFMRSLTTGSGYTTIDFKDARLGVSICYEDVFSEVSRNFVLNGANVLLTITNDAWFARTSGSHQHMVHAVFRAVETGRPMLRSGNNSDTCLILPDGSVTDRLIGPDGDPFFRGFKVYDVPIYDDLPTTFFVAHGDVFVWFMLGICVISMGYCAYRFLAARQRLLAKLKTDGEDE